MALIELRNYQEKAVSEIREKANRLFDKDDGKILVFKSPTGSGKTLMIAEWMMRLCDPFSRTDGKKFSFIWIAVNKLHDQSYDNLKKFYEKEGLGLHCSYFEDIEDKQIKQNEILFLNWASINKEGNIYVRVNERNNNLTNIIEKTKEAGRTIVLIIDESHHTAKSDHSRELIKGINPKLTIELSATPQLTNFVDEIVRVELADVKQEEMIKKEVSINPGFEDYKFNKKIADKAANEIVIEEALKKRMELMKKLSSEGSSVNPLVLIQIPDAHKGLIDKKDTVIEILSKYGITTKNGKLAIYLSEKDNKINLSNIEKNDNEVEVMIFKQAIALGWDCPRASILVLFREWKSLVFSIQTIGRIMRMPEHRHYKNQELNIGYVYTSLSDISIAEDIAKEYINVFYGRRQFNYKNIDLISYHSKRFREETRLSADFVPIFFKAAEELKLKEISLKHSIVDTKLIASGRITDIDAGITSIKMKGLLAVPKTKIELQSAFDNFSRENLAPFAPELRSIKRINDSIYRFFDKSFKMGLDDWPKIQAIVLADENRQMIIDVINRAKELYQEIVGKGKHEVVQNDNPWNIPEEINYNITFIKKDYKKSIIQPYYAKTQGNNSLSNFEEDSEIEVEFIKLLEKSKKVKWWFKNGRQDGSYFAVPYVENDSQKAFYVDFVVLMNNNSIGLFDTKGGIYAQTAKYRAEGLANYIATQNKKIFGGIVVKEKNSWRYNDNKKYLYDPSDISNWKFLDLI
jgi:type III restriction enzyme